MDSARPSATLSGWPIPLRSTSSISCCSKGLWLRRSTLMFLFMSFPRMPLSLTSF